jgi:2-methylcitrate dehydratase
MNGALPYDRVLIEIADYVHGANPTGERAMDTARWCLLDTIGCALEALHQPDCMRLLGPTVPGTSVEHGAHVPGTAFRLDPATAAFNLGAMLRWTDFSDTFVALTTMHPSDDIAAILPLADYLSRVRRASGAAPLTVQDVLRAIVEAHEIQGALGMGNRFSENGIDHSLLVRVACSALAAALLGGSRDQIAASLSLAFFDAGLCVHRYGSNTGPRKGWASAEAASSAVRLALLALKGEPGYPQVLSHPKWGFEKVFLGGRKVALGAPLGSHVMENVLFKIQAPVVIHAQSAIECALKLHPLVNARFRDIEAIRLRSHHRTLATIDKTGPLRNAADRDHCLQYAVAVALLKGRHTADDYQDAAAADPRIDALRARMQLTEDPRYTQAYRDEQRRANMNAIEIVWKDGSRGGPVEVEYPIGHPRRRAEGIPLLLEKFEGNLARCYPAQRCEAILARCLAPTRLLAMGADDLTDLFPVCDSKRA